MRFEQALEKLQAIRPGVMQRKAWDAWKDDRYVWIYRNDVVTETIGNVCSSPILLTVTDYLANDWIVSNSNEQFE